MLANATGKQSVYGSGAPMKHLDLFSGIGGFALAARWVGWETVGFCEIDPYCQKVLRKHWPDVPIYEDIKAFNGQDCDIITAGFPCQPYSVAGKQRGDSDHRALWREVIRIVENTKPTWVLCENVASFIKIGLDQMSLYLESRGYSVESLCIPACAVNTPHRRERLWILAHTERGKQPRKEPRSRKAGRMGREQQSVAWDRDWESALTEFRGMDDGLSGRVVTNRTDGLRNAIVPQIAEIIFRAIDESRCNKLNST